MKRKKNKPVKYNIMELEKETMVICQDFAAFCDYVLEKEVKLAKRTGNIGKKDCFELNALLHVKEKYEKPTHMQSDYPIISFFYYVALKYKILEANQTQTVLQKGRNYSLFWEVSSWEQYLLFLAVFLFDGMFTVKGGYWYTTSVSDMWELYVDSFMEWVYEEKPCTGSRQQLTRNSRIEFFYKLDVMIPYLEEFHLIKVWNRPDAEKRGDEYWWGIEVLPLLEVVSDLYENTYIDEEEVTDKDALIQCSYEAYMDRLMPKQKEDGLARLFGNAEAENLEQTIDLEVIVRYTACVRVIRMNVSDTLYDLHRMIQKAVAFDDDHLFQFTIGRGMMKKVYVLPDMMQFGEELSVTETRLSALELRKGQVFSYLFDFGDMWWFDIKVLAISEGAVKAPEVIKAVNDAPEQYPLYEEEEEGWQAEITAQVKVSDILASIEDELIETEYTALMGLKEKQQKKAPDEMRREMERILVKEPDRMLAFMTVEMQEILSELLQEEWISDSEKCTVAKLYSFGFCAFPETGDKVISVPEAVKDVYLAKLKSTKKQDKIVETAEVFLRRCGVMETEQLYLAVRKFLKSRISYDDFEFLVYSRLHYFGTYYCGCFNGEEYMSCYGKEMTEQILSERLQPENVAYEYPDFSKLYSKDERELSKAQEDWKEYVKFHLYIDWGLAEELITEIPAMAASGVMESDKIFAVYKEKLRGAGSRATKKAGALINELCTTMPLATRKGNTGSEKQDSDSADLDGSGLDSAGLDGADLNSTDVNKADVNSTDLNRESTKKEDSKKSQKAVEEGYIQLSIFDL